MIDVLVCSGQSDQIPMRLLRFEWPVSRVPWGLMDELETERVKWEREASTFERHIKERMMQRMHIQRPRDRKRGPPIEVRNSDWILACATVSVLLYVRTCFWQRSSSDGSGAAIN
jgi:hypothetical protein